MPFFLLANIGMLAFYSFVTYKLFFHTDAATKLLLANEVLTLGELLPNGWCYVNNDVWVFLNHIFLVPLIRLLGLNYFSYALNNLVFYGLYGLSIYFFLGRSAMSGLSKILVGILAISSLSHCYATFLFGEIAYITSHAFIFLWLGLVNRVVSCDEGELNKYYLGLFLILGVFTIHNPQRTLIYNLLPVLLVCLYLYFMDGGKRARYLRLGLVGIGTFVGSVVIYYGVIARGVIIRSGATHLKFADYEGMLNHVNIFFVGLLDAFNLVDGQTFSAFSFEGIVRLGSFCFFFLIVCSLIKISKKFDRENIDGLAACLMLFYYLFVNMFLYIFTSPLAQNVTTFRYFYPVVLLSFIVMALFMNRVGWDRRLKTAVVVLVVLFLSFSNYAIYVKPGVSKPVNGHEHLGEYLAENGLTYGFASYWHSYVTTVFADNDALVAPIHMSGFVPMKWLSSKDWYTRYGVDESFIVFDPVEYESYYPSIVKRIGREPARVDSVDGFKIAVFDKNIAYELNRVYHATLEQGIDFTIEGYPDFIREWDGFSGYEPSRRWSKGKRSALIFNEKLPGSFNLVFSGAPFVVSKNSSLAVVVGTDEQRIDLKSGFQQYRVAFENVDADKIEFIYKQPISPVEMNMGRDRRKLSFAFNFIKIEDASPVER